MLFAGFVFDGYLPDIFTGFLFQFGVLDRAGQGFQRGVGDLLFGHHFAGGQATATD
jgi:hypothetical protein